jgi:hypothetical protein
VCVAHLRERQASGKGDGLELGHIESQGWYGCATLQKQLLQMREAFQRNTLHGNKRVIQEWFLSSFL